MANVRQDNVQIKLEIDGSQSRTELDNLSRKSKLLQEDLKGLKKGTQEYVEKNKEIATLTTRMGELQKEIGLTSLTTGQLGAMSRQLGRELSQLTPETEAWINKSKELTEVDDRLALLRKQAKGVKEDIENAGGGFLSFVKKSAAFTGIQLGIESVVSSLKQLGSESIDAAAKGSDSIADMEKSLGVTTEGAKALREQLEGIDTRTSQENLEGIAIAGGQLGVAAADVDEFTGAVDEAVVALGDEFTGGVDDVTKSIGGLQKLFKDTADLKPDQAITKIGSALNALGADGSATAPVVADFAARIGQLGDLAPEISQTLGLGAAFQELGLSAEISSGGLTNVLLTASKDTAGFAKQLGLTQEQFIKLLNSDPNEVILKLAESLKGASNTEIVATLDQLGIKSQEATKVVSLLANQTDIVRQKQALASAEMAKGTSLTDEFNKKNTTSAAEIEKAEKGFARYRQELGEKLIPIYVRMLQLSGFLVGALRALPAFVSENKIAFGLLAAAVLTFNGAQVIEQATALRGLALRKLVALGLVTETAGTFTLVGAKTLATKAQERLNTAMRANPIGLIITAVALLAFGLKELYDRSEKVREVFAGLGSVATFVFNNIKDVALASLAGVGGLLAGIFTFDPVLIKQSLVTLKKTGSDLSKAYHEGYSAQEAKEQAAKQSRETKQLADDVARQQKAAADKLAREKQAAAAAAAALLEQQEKQHLQSLKLREIALQRQLAQAEEGSEQELKLKKQLVLVARDIELADVKKTEDEKVLIVAGAQLELDKLNADYRKKRKELVIKQYLEDAKEAEKRALEEAEAAAAILKRKAALEKDAFVRRTEELRAAAAAEAVKLKGSDAQVAEQRRLIQEKLEADLLKLEQERIDRQIDADRRVEQSDLEIALRRVQRKKQEAGLSTKAGQDAAEEETAIKTALLKSDMEADLENQNLTINEKLARFRQFHADVKDLNAQAADDQEDEENRRRDIIVGLYSQAIDTVATFQKAATDKELSKLDKDKTARLLKLDQEYKAGTLSKEQYESAKSNIESNYDAKTRSIKKQAAEKEKEYNIAQAIIAGTLAVIKVLDNPFLAVTTGIAAALGVAKIIATPIPEFAKGGVIGGPKPTWREKVRQFATGGINSVAGVPSVGQLHSGGGIRMVDGATGQHLGEWERGEPYMILSRETYANNKPLIDDLLDTSLYRGGAPVRPRGGYYEEGGTPGGSLPGGGQGAAAGVELIRAVQGVESAVRALPSRQRIAWESEDTAYLEDELSDRQQVRSGSGVS
jgi:hypothetical protein